MRKNIMYSAIFLMLFACNSQKKEKEVQGSKTNSVTTTSNDDSKIGRKNYAIVWEWTTTDKQLVEDNLIAISNEMNELWKNDVIENVYYNSNAKANKFEYFPNISYFLKAKSIDKAKGILDNLLVVRKGIAKYNIYPVGLLWLDRNKDVINKRKITNSYVSVWSTLKDIDQNKDAELMQKQIDAMLSLYNAGTIENAYWELAGEVDAEKRRTNEIADFVFFLNTTSEEDAKKICNNLPFTKKGLVSYKLLPVGIFWLGKYEDNQ